MTFRLNAQNICYIKCFTDFEKTKTHLIVSNKQLTKICDNKSIITSIDRRVKPSNDWMEVKAIWFSRCSRLNVLVENCFILISNWIWNSLKIYLKRFVLFDRKAVRATLILIPLLGLQFMLTPFRPETKSTAEKVHEIVSAIVTSLQVE